MALCQPGIRRFYLELCLHVVFINQFLLLSILRLHYLSQLLPQYAQVLLVQFAQLVLPFLKLTHKKLLITHSFIVLVLPLAANLKGLQHFGLLTVVKFMGFPEISFQGLMGDVPHLFRAL